MALGGEVHHVVHVVLIEYNCHHIAVANVTTHEYAALAVYVVLDGSKVAGVGQRVENDHLYLLVGILLVEQILHKVGADESCGARHQIGLLHFLFFYVCSYLLQSYEKKGE